MAGGDCGKNHTKKNDTHNTKMLDIHTHTHTIGVLEETQINRVRIFEGQIRNTGPPAQLVLAQVEVEGRRRSRCRGQHQGDCCGWRWRHCLTESHTPFRTRSQW